MPKKRSIESVLLPHVEAGELAGAAALIWRDGAIQDIATVGRRDLRTGLPIERDTIFRLASLTKPVTALAALTLFDEGKFKLDDSIASWAPELARMRVLRNADGPLDATDAAARAITFRDLLTHRAGLSYAEFHRGPIGHALTTTLGKQIDNPLTPDEWVERLATLPLIDQPGAGFHYGCSSDLLGFLIARIEGVSLGEVLQRRVFAPLGMRDTGFNVPREKRSRRAELCGFDDQGKLTTLAAPPGGHAMAERPDDMAFQSGSGGLWSTLDDYLAFACALIDERPDAPRLLRPETRALMLANQLTPEQRAAARMFGRSLFARGHGYGMGLAVVMEPEHADPLVCRGGVGTVGWPGAYGGWWQADPTRQSVQIFLAHNMLELSQMARGIGLAVWSAIGAFYALGSDAPKEEREP